MIVRSMRDAGQIVDDPEINSTCSPSACDWQSLSAGRSAPLHVLCRAPTPTSTPSRCPAASSASTRASIRRLQRNRARGRPRARDARTSPSGTSRSIQNAGRATEPRSRAPAARGDPDRRDDRPAKRCRARQRDHGQDSRPRAKSTTRVRTRPRQTASASASSLPRSSTVWACLNSAGTMQAARQAAAATQHPRYSCAPRPGHEQEGACAEDARPRAATPRPRTPRQRGCALIHATGSRLRSQLSSTSLPPSHMCAHNARRAPEIARPPRCGNVSPGRALALVPGRQGRRRDPRSLEVAAANRRPDVTATTTALGQAHFA